MSLEAFSYFEIYSENQVDELINWLEEQDTFPMTIYINGICITFPDKNWKDCFQLGFSTARDIFEELQDNKWKTE